MKINFEDKFNELNLSNDILKKIETENIIQVFYGFSKEGKKRLAFQSNNKPDNIESTKVISVSLYKDNENKFWISFDLEDNKYSNLFYTFCSDMISSFKGLQDEIEEIKNIKNRFNNWKKMFQNIYVKELSEEKEQGLFGELYFLYNYMIPKYGIDSSVSSWAGPLKFNKDFSINDTWYEVKTSSVSSTNIKITSLNQLDSKNDGFLSVVRVEKMSPEYNGNSSSVYDLIQKIMEKITNLSIQDDFLNKIIEYGIGPENNFGSRKYIVKVINIYGVKDGFPRLTNDSISFSEIENVSYSISISGIEKYIVEVI